MHNDHDQGHSHHLDTDHPRSVSQPGLLENLIEFDSRLDNLITKTSELNELTVQGVQEQFKYSAIWILFVLFAGLGMLYVFYFVDQ